MVEVYPGPSSGQKGARSGKTGRERTVGVYDRKKKGPSWRIGIIGLILIVAAILVILLFSRARGETIRLTVHSRSMVVSTDAPDPCHHMNFRIVQLPGVYRSL
jgi:hypothetical protein